MMVLISPAKKLDATPSVLKESTTIRFQKELGELVKIMKTKSAQDLMKMMDISKKLADLNVQRYKDFDVSMPKDSCKQALYAFNGDVYQGLQVKDFTNRDIAFAQDHLRILSGLYGLLRPLDLIQEYRLEMGCGFKTGKWKDLYHFWGDKISNLIIDDMKTSKDKLLINLASEEYFTVINTSLFKDRLYHVRFEEKRGNTYKIISFSAKKARGLMARFIIKNKIKTTEEMKNFSIERYVFNPDRSSEFTLSFTR